MSDYAIAGALFSEKPEKKLRPSRAHFSTEGTYRGTEYVST